ncbi:SlyX family protein [Pelagibacterium montanilacus]|uniref:SlyX family protein n=1 Tax=Pelagibacterium montanilacus TaxID=2185280 RepID=UPI000F8DEAC0|nr:SlyX family protein [Pelagibacterium montanilacus]
MAEGNEDRIVELEIRNAQAENAIEDMSGAVTDQWSRIETLERRIEQLTDRVARLEAVIRETGVEPPPPHY